MNKIISKKVGEEAVEVVIEALDNKDDLFLRKCRFIVSLSNIVTNQGFELEDVVRVLKKPSRNNYIP
jgi:phosphoribosyl-ATP pyrophosphohydrolase/phosphoribosyl-AMP cyclohydrolase